MEKPEFLRCQYVDILNRAIFPAEVEIFKGRITAIRKLQPQDELPFLISGFIDAHVHIESSMLVPSEFARLAVCHGTVATISDPHEIANVCGMQGVEFMIENGKQVPFKFYFGAPSCVPATTFETAGASLGIEALDQLMQRKDIAYMAEMMNWPGVVNRDPEVMGKIAIAQKYGKPVDGHAPGLKGELAKKYVSAGISTDHECFTYEEGLEKIKLGMKVAIREGSAAKNFDALIDLIDEYPDQIMFCSDDKHPDSLVEDHINQLAARAVAKGKDVFDVLKAACLNPIEHYAMNVGQLKVGDPADAVLVEDLKSFKVLKTYVDGKLVAADGKSFIQSVQVNPINHFNSSPKTESDFSIKATSEQVRTIMAQDGQLITPSGIGKISVKEGFAHANLKEDILKITVVNRYEEAKPAVAFIQNFGLKTGAIASTVAHDSHNIIAIGVDDASICRAVNLLMESKGGVSAVSGEKEMLLPLPVAGLMSAEDGYQVAEDYIQIDRMAKEMGSTLQSPYMTLSFMALLVIPELKLSDKGLFDGNLFGFTSVFLES